MSTSPQQPTFVLVPGHWLGAWAWDAATAHLAHAGRASVAVTLPGLDLDDPSRLTRTLDDQVAALIDALEGIADPRGSVVVAHSGANAPVSLLLDRRPELVARVVWVDSGPVGSGAVANGGLPEGLLELSLPAFDELGQFASLEGLVPDVLDEFRRRAVSMPVAVVSVAVELSGEAGAAVPTTLVCCSIDAASIRGMIAAGQPMFAEVAKCVDVTYVDLPTGHWPMWSRPADLAEVLVDAAPR